ncbi:MAG: alpha/beta hydrolase [Parvibaculaceae bacterium]|nr:alpha/beta hydrolase [Parvibaculaceae bacterium]
MAIFLMVIVGLLVGMALFSAVRNRRAERTYPPVGRFVDVQGARLHYYEMGTRTDRPSIVLIHGASGNLRDFVVSIMPDLARTHHVIAFDRPGHGWSERVARADISDPAAQAHIIHEALASLNIEKPVLLGHSWGGGLAAAYALAYPDGLSGLLVLSGATHAWEGKVAWYHGLIKAPIIGWLFLRTLLVPASLKLTDQGVIGNFAPDRAPEGYADSMGLALLFRPKNFRHNSEDVRSLQNYLRAQSVGYGNIRVPTIVITGNRDKTVWAKLHSYALHEQISGSELIKLQGVGHMPHHVHGDIVREALDRLVRGEAPQAGTHVLLEAPVSS